MEGSKKFYFGLGKMYYFLYYFVICRDKEIIKFRVVYDVLVKMNGNLFLNDCFYFGLNFFFSIVDVLMRFWFYNVKFIFFECYDKVVFLEICKWIFGIC